MSDPILFDGLVVLVRCADNKLHLVPLTMKQTARVRRFVTQLHEGRLHLDPRDLLLMTERDAMEAFSKLTGKVPAGERIRRFFGRFRRKAPTASEAVSPEAPNPIPQPRDQIPSSNGAGGEQRPQLEIVR